jgi:predicted MPP superfamily phosphohydrolase
VKILAMSDVHNNRAVLDDLLRVAEKQAPDYICLAGDTLDRADCDATSLVEWLGELAKIATVIIGLGNHELSVCGRGSRHGLLARGRLAYGRSAHGREAGENVDFYTAVEKIKNCVLLRDEFSVYDAGAGVVFSALNMPERWYGEGRENKHEFQKVARRLPVEKLDAGKLNVMLSHSPNGWLYRGKLLPRDEFKIMKTLDLILSGHNHGGLVPKFLRPILRHYGFVGPNFKIVQPHAFGRWTDGSASLVLSNGVTKFAETSGLSALGRLLNWFYIPDVEVVAVVPGEQYELVKNR